MNSDTLDDSGSMSRDKEAMKVDALTQAHQFEDIFHIVEVSDGFWVNFQVADYCIPSQKISQ